MNEELLNQIKMTYNEQVEYLLDKYGKAEYDYFTSEDCKAKNKKITRTSEGLFCHHIFEDRYDNLGQVGYAKRFPFECQKKENLVYCDYIEHLILHLKINLNSRSTFSDVVDINKFFNSLGFYWIANDINYLYKNGGSDVKWRNDCYLKIIDDFDDYLDILKGVFCYLESNYTGPKEDLKVGDNVRIDIMDLSVPKNKDEIRGHQYSYKTVYWTILEMDAEKNTILIQTEKGDTKEFEYKKFMNGNNYSNVIRIQKRILSSFSDKTLWDDLYNFLMDEYSEDDYSLAFAMSKCLNQP